MIIPIISGGGSGLKISLFLNFWWRTERCYNRGLCSIISVRTPGSLCDSTIKTLVYVYSSVSTQYLSDKYHRYTRHILYVSFGQYPWWMSGGCRCTYGICLVYMSGVWQMSGGSWQMSGGASDRHLTFVWQSPVREQWTNSNCLVETVVHFRGKIEKVTYGYQAKLLYKLAFIPLPPRGSSMTTNNYWVVHYFRQRLLTMVTAAKTLIESGDLTRPILWLLFRPVFHPVVIFKKSCHKDR